MKMLLPLCAILLLGGPAFAMKPAVLDDSNPMLLRVGATDCKGPIASEKHPIMGAALLAKMRREGKLPDRFVCGRCEYDLAGDPGAAYYVMTCK